MEIVHLASASQRRASMLEQFGLEFTQMPLRARERPHKHGTTITEQVENTLLGKIEAAKRECAAPLVIVADTLVEDPDDSLNPMGKPTNRQEALNMLLRLSGRNHRVWSGTAVLREDVVEYWVTSATVSIQPLSDDELEALILTESWRGKAGGYDLAGAMGQFAEIVDGEEETVLGLCPQLFNYLEEKLD
ncbi:MAG: Maf family protein [Candidatus Thermoplasmatota archaeon]|nr:Maf family protein [Candidatus Thermoplasmatota archaeon]